MKHAPEHDGYFFYEGANHGFHNDTTPRYDAEAATLAWNRTIGFLGETLGEEPRLGRRIVVSPLRALSRERA